MFRALILLADLVVAMALLVPTILCGLYSLFIVKKKKEIGAILHLSCGASTQGVLDKFGSLNNIFDYDGEATKGVFNKNILFWFASRNSLRFNFANGWVILEQRKVFGLLPIASIFTSFIRLFQLIRSENIKLIRGWDPYFSGVAACILHYLFKIPFCISIHTDYDQRYKVNGAKGAPVLLGSRNLAKVVEKYVLKNADRVLPLQDNLVVWVSRYGVTADRIRMVPQGVNFRILEKLDGGDLFSRLSIPKDKAILSFAGRLSRENYVDDVLYLTRELAKTRSDFVVVMAGDGTEKERLVSERESDALLKNHLIMPGYLSHEDVNKLRKISSVGLCLVGGFSLIESCAVALPVIAYDIEWHREIVADGTTGFLLQESDKEGVCRAAKYLLDNPIEAKIMGKRAQDVASRRHNIENTSIIKRNCYRELIGLTRGQ